MVHVGLLVKLEAKPGKVEELQKFLEGALPLANAEEKALVWFALRLGESTFGIFDAFEDDTGRQEHLRGEIATALMGRADELLASPPQIEHVDVLAAKVDARSK